MLRAASATSCISVPLRAAKAFCAERRALLHQNPAAAPIAQPSGPRGGVGFAAWVAMLGDHSGPPTSAPQPVGRTYPSNFCSLPTTDVGDDYPRIRSGFTFDDLRTCSRSCSFVKYWEL